MMVGEDRMGWECVIFIVGVVEAGRRAPLA